MKIWHHYIEFNDIWIVNLMYLSYFDSKFFNSHSGLYEIKLLKGVLFFVRVTFASLKQLF